MLFVNHNGAYELSDKFFNFIKSVIAPDHLHIVLGQIAHVYENDDTNAFYVPESWTVHGHSFSFDILFWDIQKVDLK